MGEVCQLFEKSIKSKQWWEDLAVIFSLLVRALIFDILLDKEGYMQDFFWTMQLTCKIFGTMEDKQTYLLEFFQTKKHL